MTNKIKIILFIFIGLAILAIIGYGVLSSKKLDEHKEKKVQSNINEYIYDEARDTIDPEEEEEDLDGEEAVVEDDDFEVFEEDDGWEDTDLEEEQVEKEPESVTNKYQRDDELEELYDNRKPKPTEAKPIEAKTITKPKVETQPEKTTASNPSVPFSGSDNFLVVVGSFRSKANAGKKLKELEKTGIKGEILQPDDSKIHVVIAGRFATEADAEALVTELKEEHGLKAFAKAN